MNPPFTYRSGEVRDADGRQMFVIVTSGCTKKFRDRCGKTLVGILNAEERGRTFIRQTPASRAALKQKDGGNG